jgi:hypothetical protein
MGLVNPSQSNPGDTIEASDINGPVNQLAAVLNGNVDASNVAANSVTYDKLVANIFGGRVTTLANAGSAGGTMYYVNLAGIKLLWATSATQGFSAAAPPQTFNVAFTLPASFFTTIQTVLPSWGPAVNTQYVYTSLSTATTSSIVIHVNEHAGTSGTGQVHLLVIGT